MIKRNPACCGVSGRHLATTCFLLIALTLGACAKVLEPLDAGSEETDEGDELAASPLVRLATCWPGLPLAEDLLAAYASVAPDVSIDVLPSSSKGAIALMQAERADLAIVEYEPDIESEAPVENKGRKATGPTALALNAIGVIVQKDFPLDHLSSAELAALFLGHYVDWEELGAEGGRVEIISQGNDTRARALFEEKVLGGQPTSSAAIVIPHDRGVLEYVAQHRGAIGYLSMSYVDERVKALAIDGIAPQTSEIRQGRYPLVHPLVLLVAPNAQPQALHLAAFASSSKGRQAIAKRYTLPR